MSALADLRGRGLALEGGARLRVRGPAAVVETARPLLAAQRDVLLDELQDEAERDIAEWPAAYRHWLFQTIALALREAFSKREAFWMGYRAVRAALEEDRAQIIATAAAGGENHERRTATGDSPSAGDAGDPMSRAALEVFGEHQGTPME